MDGKGIIQSLNYNNQMRSQFLNLPIDKIQPLYNALKLFDDICYDNEYLINLKLLQKIKQVVAWDSFDFASHKNYTNGGFELIMKRHKLKYIINYYLPSGLFVVVSWV